MEESGPKWFTAQLDQVQATYQGGESQGVYQQLRTTMAGLPRRADVSLEARCVGAAGWERMYQLRRTITATLGKQSENADKLANTGGALDWYVLGDNRDDAQRVIPKLTPTPEGTGYVINRLRNEIGMLNQAQESGFELLPEERTARGTWQKGLDDMIAYARKQGATILDKEAGLLTRAATTAEEKIEQARDNQRTLIADYLGDESLAVRNEALREVNRAKASLEMLVTARDWLQPIATADAAPVRDRALVRGDALLARGGDTSLGLEARDSLFKAADNYFKFAANTQRQQVAAQGRTGIAPALQAERDARKARINQKGAELQESSRMMKESIEKTGAQKKNFKDEADAMEDELGF